MKPEDASFPATGSVFEVVLLIACVLLQITRLQRTETHRMEKLIDGWLLR